MMENIVFVFMLLMGGQWQKEGWISKSRAGNA